MPSANLIIEHEHNHACETATLADCHCFCHGAGHQNDLIVRAVLCNDSDHFAGLLTDLERVLGGFHASQSDIMTHSRGSRSVPEEYELAQLRIGVGKGASWFETLIVDEGLHAAFVEIAAASMEEDTQARSAQRAFVERITTLAIDVIGSDVDTINIVDSHVWCSIVSEYLDELVSGHANHDYSEICYPRKTHAQRPAPLADVRQDGLQLLRTAYGSEAASSLSAERKIQIIRLVGAATCPDLWRHPAAVRFCLYPFAENSDWPTSQTTRIATLENFQKLRTRWRVRRHWLP
jgi:hypothetical protein